MDFEHYVAEFRVRLYRFAVVLCSDPVLAGDVLSDVLGRAFERWDQVGAAHDVHAYVRRMIVNEFISWKRRRARVTPRSDVPALADRRVNLRGVPGPDHESTHADRESLLTELARLSPRARSAIVLRFYEDLDDDAIGEVLGCRPGTVRSLVSRGLASLRINIDTSEDRTRL